jgi:hypothetical protein
VTAAAKFPESFRMLCYALIESSLGDAAKSPSRCCTDTNDSALDAAVTASSAEEIF